MRRVRITVRDRATNQLTPCRINVVGPDGTSISRPPTGSHPTASPESGRKQVRETARARGRFDISAGSSTRPEKPKSPFPPALCESRSGKGSSTSRWCGASTSRPRADTPGFNRTRTHDPMAAMGYYSGDPHLHFPRKTEADDQVILDLLEAEDIHFGSILAYNEPPGPTPA